MSLVIDNPAAVEQLNAFATSRGLTVDEAIIEALSDFEDDADEVRAAVEEALADSMSIEDFAAERKTTRKTRTP